jgi:Ca2+-binding RTX toxin-like protein
MARFSWRKWFGFESNLCRREALRRSWLSVEALEDRNLLNGNAVAFFVNGYGGANVPPDVMQHIDDLFSNAHRAGIIHNFDIYETNWNSPDPTSFVYDSSHHINGGAISGHPGSILSNLLDPIPGPTLFNFNFPTGLKGKVDPNPADPRLPDDFVNTLTNILNTQYDDHDLVVLVGHSFGGNSVLRVANQTTRKIDLLATFDPVGWSFTGQSTSDNVVIIPEVNVPVPGFAQSVFGSSFTVPGTPLSIPVPVGAFSTILSGNLDDPKHGFAGFRNELPQPGSNVHYFYNRWQTNFPFPFDYNDSGQLDASQVTRSVETFSYLGQPIASQEAANDYRDVNGNVETHDANFLDFVFGHAHADITLPSIHFGDAGDPDPRHFRLPSINISPVISGGSFNFTSSSITHQDLPLDHYLQAQLNAILDRIAPSQPTANAGPDQQVNEGDTVALNGSAHANDPNSPLAYKWALISGPTTVSLSDPNVLDPTFVTPDGGDYTFQLTVTNLDTGIVSDPNDPNGLVTIHVTNLPPMVDPISEPSTGVRGFPQQFSVAFTDPGYLNTFTGSWSFGDTQGIAFRPVRSPDSVTHTYTASGIYEVTATIQDDEGARTPVSTQINIKGAGLIPDPTDPGKTALAVGGTTGDDDIVLQCGPTTGQLHVIINGTDEGTFSPTGHILVDGFDGNDKLTLDYSNGGFVTPDGLVWDGGAGTNTLAVIGRTSVWTVTGHNQGFVNGGITFVNTQNLAGGDSTNDFIFQAGGFIDGNVNGGGGYDILDIGTLGSQHVTLTNDDATGFTGLTAGMAPIGGYFKGIDKLLGSTLRGTSTLVGENLASKWTITASGDQYNDVTTGQTLDFSNIESLTGGSGADLFIFKQGGNISGNIDSGAGSNTVDYSALAGPVTVNLQSHTATGIGGTFANITDFVGSAGPDTLIGPDVAFTWDINGANAGSVNGLTFGSFENLTGGSAADRFVFLGGGSVTGNIDGGGGSNALDYSQYPGPITINLASNTATGIGGTFANITTFIANANPNNTVVGPNTSNSWLLTGPNNVALYPFTFSGFPNLVGGSVADRFVIETGASLSGKIDGAGGINTLDYSGYTGDVTVDLPLNLATGIGGGVFHIQNVTGSIGNDLLVGDASPNVLKGGTGRNVIIGGAGANTIVGGGGDNILIGGTTAYDTNLQALMAVMAEWTRTDLSFQQRLAHLISEGNNDKRLNGSYVLNKKTVFADGAQDSITGGSALDWVFLSLKDDLFFDREPQDHLTGL